MKRIFVAGLAGFALSVLAGCQQSQAPGNNMTAASDIDQDTLCQVSTWKPINVASQCEAGQKILYRPGDEACLLYTSPSSRDKRQSRMPSSA